VHPLNSPLPSAPPPAVRPPTSVSLLIFASPAPSYSFSLSLSFCMYAHVRVDSSLFTPFPISFPSLSLALSCARSMNATRASLFASPPLRPAAARGKKLVSATRARTDTILWAPWPGRFSTTTRGNVCLSTLPLSSLTLSLFLFPSLFRVPGLADPRLIRDPDTATRWLSQIPRNSKIPPLPRDAAAIGNWTVNLRAFMRKHLIGARPSFRHPLFADNSAGRIYGQPSEPRAREIYGISLSLKVAVSPPPFFPLSPVTLSGCIVDRRTSIEQTRSLWKKLERVAVQTARSVSSLTSRPPTRRGGARGWGRVGGI